MNFKTEWKRVDATCEDCQLPMILIEACKDYKIVRCSGCNNRVRIQKVVGPSFKVGASRPDAVAWVNREGSSVLRKVELRLSDEARADLEKLKTELGVYEIQRIVKKVQE